MERQPNGIRRKPLGFRPLHSFRLSTWFVLVGIVAWAMMCRPYFGRTVVEAWGHPSTGGIRIIKREIGGYVTGSQLEDACGIDEHDSTRWSLFVEHRSGFNPNLIYPALALAAFVGWKAAWAIGRRARATSACNGYFRFGLRTMFVALTACLLWLGYEANWIQQRHAALDNPNLTYWNKDRVQAPGLLWLFGETGHPRIVVENGDKSEVRRVGRLFPEAEVETAYWRP